MNRYSKLFVLKFLVLLFSPVFGQNILLRGPYLQLGTTTSIVIKWKTSMPTDSQVKIGFIPGLYYITKELNDQTKEHEVTIDNLLPASRYYYTIGSSQEILQGDSSNYFLTYPNPSTDRKYRFWITGDCGNNSANQRQVRDQYLTYTGNTPTDGWLLLGDNAYYSGLETEYDLNFFKQYQETIMKHTVLWPALGNHDYGNNATLQISKQVPYYNLFTLPTKAEAGGVASGTESYYSYNIGNIHFIALDSYGMESANYRLYDTLSPQVTWLKKDLESNQQTWTIAYWHHPPYTKGSHDSDGEDDLIEIRKNLLRILERYTVDLVLCGHSHSYERSRLMKGHYDFSSTFDENRFLKNRSTAFYNGTLVSCPYIKQTNKKGEGIVYVVSGSAGQVGGSTSGFPHPAMLYSNRTEGGSLILEIEKNRLDLKWLSANGNINDALTMMKDVGISKTVTLPYGDEIELTASWIGNYEWNKKGETTSSILVSPITDTLYVVKDKFNCLADSFKITIDRITGINNSGFENSDIKIFPNPTDGVFWIELPHSQFYKIDLLDVFGKIIYTKALHTYASNQRIKIKLEEFHLSSGLYFLSVSDWQKQRVRKLIIK